MARQRAVAIGVGRVFDDNIPDSQRNAVIQSVLLDQSLPKLLLLNNIKGYHLAGNRYLDYGRKEYIYGLPTADITGEYYPLHRTHDRYSGVLV